MIKIGRVGAAERTHVRFRQAARCWLFCAFYPFSNFDRHVIMKLIAQTAPAVLFTALASAVFAGCQEQADDAVVAVAGTEPAGYVTLPPEEVEPEPTELLPEAAATVPDRVIRGDLQSVNWNSLVGQTVTIKGDLQVIDTYNLVRYGEVNVARERLFVPTSRIDPNDKDPSGTSSEGGNNVAKVIAARKQNAAAVLTIDDGRNSQNVFPPLLFPELGRSQPTVRLGSVIRDATGRIVRKQNRIVLVPNRAPKWKPARRPARPDVGRADITVASFNVLNYFSTIDNGNNDARGADSRSEFKRQESKIVAAISGLNADVIGLMELENKAGVEAKLVAALNKAAGKNVFKGCGIPSGFRRAPGGQDAIRVGVIYRADRVTPDGGVTMIKDAAFYSARTPLAQTFTAKEGGKPFTVVVNHFKSKGGADNAEPVNKDKGDGQGAYNAARRGQASALVQAVNAFAQREQNPRVLILGDLNAYQEEDPIDAMRAAGLIDLAEKHVAKGQPHYSYVYRGQCGSLDHAFATKALADDVTGVATWHINADEPRWVDYNEEYNPKTLFKADPFRSSDHDPVLIGIRK